MSSATLLVVFTAVIVVFNIVQYGESHRFNKKQIRFLNGQLAEMRSSSLQTGQTIAAWQDQAHSLTGQLNAFANSQRAFVSLVNVQATPTVLINGRGAWIMQSVWINSGNTQTKRLTPLRKGAVMSHKRSLTRTTKLAGKVIKTLHCSVPKSRKS
jgi:hypothetical protein